MQELKARPKPSTKRRPQQQSAQRTRKPQKKGYDIFTIMSFAFLMASVVAVGVFAVFQKQKSSIQSSLSVVNDVLSVEEQLSYMAALERQNLLARLEADEVNRKLLQGSGMWQTDMLQYWMMFVHEKDQASVIYVNKTIPELRMYFSGKITWQPQKGGVVFVPDYPMIAPKSLPFIDDDKSKSDLKALSYQPLSKDEFHFDVSFEGSDMLWSVPWRSFKGVPADPEVGEKGLPSHPIFRYVSTQALRWMPLDSER